MIISHEKKFIFFACGKTGTTSIENVLQKYHDSFDLDVMIREELLKRKDAENKPYIHKHVRPAMLKGMMPKQQWDSYYKFVFVRNPWDWVVANFCYNFPRLSYTLNKFEDYHVDAIWYLLKLYNQSKTADGYHQHHFAFDDHENKLVNFIGRIETIQSDFNTVCDQLKIPREELQHLNASSNTNNTYDYRELFTEEAKKLMCTRYERDIRLLGYSF